MKYLRVKPPMARSEWVINKNLDETQELHYYKLWLMSQTHERLIYNRDWLESLALFRTPIDFDKLLDGEFIEVYEGE